MLDMSRVLAGPFAGRILNDLGAEVVKVEPPEGDITRHWGKVRAGLAGYYTQQNVGKRNVCVDLQAEGGPELVLRLATEADVLIENFRPGIMKRYGLAYDDLCRVNEKLVMLSISGNRLGLRTLQFFMESLDGFNEAQSGITAPSPT